METNQSLKWMVEECATGNTRAFRLLFDQTREDLFRFIRYRVSTREDALDALQECYTDFWQAIKKGSFTYVSDAELRGFLYLIARRRVAKLYRIYRPKISLDDLMDPPDETLDPIAREEAGAAVSALQKLTQADREVVELHYFEGLSFVEIACLLEQGESAVRVRHHRAMDKMRKLLGYEK